MRFADKEAKFEQSSAELVLDCECAECGLKFNGSDRSGGHCRGGAYGGCCQSFRSLSGFDKHRTGPHEPSGQRHCLTAAEMTGQGWTCDDNNTWRMAPPAVDPWKKASA